MLTLFSSSDLLRISVLLLTSLASVVADHQSPVEHGGGWAQEHMGVVAPPAQPLAADEAVTVRGVRPQIADWVLRHAITCSLQCNDRILRLLLRLLLDIVIIVE